MLSRCARIGTVAATGIILVVCVAFVLTAKHAPEAQNIYTVITPEAGAGGQVPQRTRDGSSTTLGRPTFARAVDAASALTSAALRAHPARLVSTSRTLVTAVSISTAGAPAAASSASWAQRAPGACGLQPVHVQGHILQRVPNRDEEEARTETECILTIEVEALPMAEDGTASGLAHDTNGDTSTEMR
eukprot:CAMPEP_0185187914 /NCGR_PEP_ID=MMETSP1140-20130426/5070_1 /TAXON_ID=298111 /ORGANISM="Pavlova sp., Strain CCMP459" /LENGTH=187 /DNA_ID=CAMNT_0027754373 /DNA_START=23 /DNA_END=588 /DNA_ORIENTATION=+